MWRIKHFFKIILIQFYYQKYVVGNGVIIGDIESNILSRSERKKQFSIEKKFKHLMVYYSDFSFIFFWRISKNNHLNKFLFYNDHTSICKLFRNIDLKKGVVSYHPFSTIINAKGIGENFVFRNNTTVGNVNNDNELKEMATSTDSIELNGELFLQQGNPQEFEKDDDTNWHVKWITAASNCRAINYSIKPEDEYVTKGIAGKIIPAVATTTSTIVGLISFEMFKYICGNESLEDYSSWYMNMADNTSI